MSDEPTTPPEGDDGALLAGERLAEARRTRKISIQDIANELHLDEHKVAALERNDFGILGAPVFVKGYLRKYATTVGVPVDTVLADFDRLGLVASAQLVIPHRPKPPRDIALGPWLGGVATVAVVAGAAWWWSSTGAAWFAGRSAPATPVPFGDEAAGTSTGNDVSEPPAPVSRTAPAATGTASADTGSSAAAVDETEAATPSPVAPPPLDGRSTVELRLAFSGDCWTEVTDAKGARLYFGLGSAGRDVTVEGEPPLQVLLGNSANASLQVDGSNYPVPSTARRGDTARLTITKL